MPTAYYELLSLVEEHSTITLTLNAFGNHFHVYRNGNQICHVPFYEDDIVKIKAHYWGDFDPTKPNVPIERFIRALVPDTFSKTVLKL